MLPRNPAFIPELPTAPSDPTGAYLESSNHLESGIGESALRTAISRAMVPAVVGSQLLDNAFNFPTDEPNHLEETMRAIEPLAAKGYLGKSVNFIAGLVGDTLGLGAIATAKLFTSTANLTSVAAAKTFAYGATKAAEGSAAKVVLTAIQKENIAKFGRGALTHSAGFAGFGVFENLEAVHDPETHKFNYNKAAIGIAADGSLGALIPSGQFLLGLLRGRFSSATIKEIAESAEPGTPQSPQTPPDKIMGLFAPPENRAKAVQQKISIANKALEHGEITEEQHKWYTENAHNLDSPKAREEATRLLEKEGYTPDSTNHTIALKLITDQDTKNLEGSIPDQVFSDVDNKMAPSDLVHHNRIDEIRDNPSVANGIDGWIDHIDEELQYNEESIERMTQEALGSEPPTAFSQADILKKMEDMPSADRAQSLYTVPREVRARLNNRENVKILSPREELASIYRRLAPKGRLRTNFKNSKSYHRLLELGAYWPQARHLIDRIHLENARNAQRSYSNLLKIYSAMIKSPLQKLANPAAVTKYLRDRIENSGQKASLSNTIKLGDRSEQLPESLPQNWEGRGAEPKNGAKSSEKLNKPIPIEMEEIQHGQETRESKKGSEGNSGQENARVGGKESEKQKGGGLGASGKETKGKRGNAEVEAKQPEKSEAERAIEEWDKIVDAAEGSEQKDAYKASRRRTMKFQQSAQILANLISCQLGVTNGQV